MKIRDLLFYLLIPVVIALSFYYLIFRYVINFGPLNPIVVVVVQDSKRPVTVPKKPRIKPELSLNDTLFVSNDTILLDLSQDTFPIQFWFPEDHIPNDSGHYPIRSIDLTPYLKFDTSIIKFDTTVQNGEYGQPRQVLRSNGEKIEWVFDSLNIGRELRIDGSDHKPAKIINLSPYVEPENKPKKHPTKTL